MDESASEEEEEVTTSSVVPWSKGVPDPSNYRINHWSLNGFGEPVFTGGMYLADEIATLKASIESYCAAKNVTMEDLVAQNHDKTVRGAWQEISQCLPHRTVLSVYRRALRQCHGLARGTWTEEETATLFRLVELHGHSWRTIRDKLGRTAIDCRIKFFNQNDEFKRGKWTVEDIELLLCKVRQVLEITQNDWDVRQINEWTLDNNSKVPWTTLSFLVGRTRSDCYFKWRQMTNRSNRAAVALGLERIPMATITQKFDIRVEYYQWKAEQDPAWRKIYVEKFIFPLLQRQEDAQDTQMEQDISLLESIIASKATRPSNMPWNTVKYISDQMQPTDRWEFLVDEYASDKEMDLPMWQLARFVKSALMTTSTINASTSITTNQSNIHFENDGDNDAVIQSRNQSTSEPTPSLSKSNVSDNANRKKRKGYAMVHTPKVPKPRVPKPVPQINDSLDLSIPGADVDLIRNKIKEIIKNANRDEMKVKDVRKMLEKWLGFKLTNHKHIVKAIIEEEI